MTATTTGSVASILEAITAAPGDDLGYLVLADALEENDQGNEAELTRLSLDLRQPNPVPDRVAKEKTLQSLLATGTVPVVPTLVVPLDDEGTTLSLVLVPGGSNVLGELVEGESDSRRAVTLPAFYLGQTPVTQQQWQAVMGTNPSHFSPNGDGKALVRRLDTRHFPVEKVSWGDAQKFCAKLSNLPAEKAAGRAYRLPMEDEWEYACRAGTKTRFYTGDDDTDLDRAGWYHGNSRGMTHPVGEKIPNAYGIYDMHGNVWEWCEDEWRAVREGEQGSDPTSTGFSAAGAGATVGGVADLPAAAGSLFRTEVMSSASALPSPSEGEQGSDPTQRGSCGAGAGSTTAGSASPHIAEELILRTGTTTSDSASASPSEGEHSSDPTPIGLSAAVAGSSSTSSASPHIAEGTILSTRTTTSDSASASPSEGEQRSDPRHRRRRVVRGGSWFDYSWYCRSASRTWNVPEYQLNDIGFRICCSVVG